MNKNYKTFWTVSKVETDRYFHLERKRLTCVLLCFFGMIIFSCSQQKNGNVSFNLIPVKTDDKWGYIDHKGKYVINPQFKDADFFRDGLAKIVSSDGKTGFIDENGKYKIDAKYKEATPFSEGLAFVVSEGGYPTCIDKKGEVKFTLKQAKYVFSFSEGFAIFVTTDRKFGFVDKSGKVVINPQFKSAYPFSEGLAAIEQNDKWGFIDKTGKIVINPQFKEVQNFNDNKAAFYDGKKWGYIDKKGAYIINPQFDIALRFFEGLAAVEQGDLWGYINEKGQFEINPQFDITFLFFYDLALVQQGKIYGFINKKGKYEINPQFEDALTFYGKIAPVKSAGKWGFVDKKGKYTINPQFEEVKPSPELIKIFGGIRDYDFIESDYYDASKFVNKFFEKAGDNSFEGFTATSTLQSIADNAIYGDDVNANNKYIAYCYTIQKITEDISIDKTSFYFTNPIYENVTTYGSYWGYSYKTGTKKQYKFTEKIAAIEYQFNLSGNARGKGGVIANALKTEIENRYNVKMETKEKKYIAIQEGKLSFAITYSDYYLSFYIGFDKAKLQNLLTGTEENISTQNVEEEVTIEETTSLYENY